MVLDTNVKKFRYSIWTKIGCIILALLTFTASAQMIVKTVISAVYCEDMEGTDWTESSEFLSSFTNNLNYTIRKGYYDAMNEDFKKSLASQKDAAVEETYNKYLKLKTVEESDQVVAEGYYDEDTDEWVEETTVYFEDDIRVEIEEVKSKTSTTNAFFTISYSEIKDNSAEGKEFEYISKKYDYWVDEFWNQNIDDDYIYISESSFRNSLSYYVKNGETVLSNTAVSKFDENEYKSKSQIYFISKHGKTEYKGISESFADELYKNCIENNEYALNQDVYMFISIPDVNPSLITSVRFWNDDYINYYYFNDYAVKANANISKMIAFEIILLVVSFVSGFYALTAAGKRKDGSVKLLAIDKNPFEIHTILTFAIGGLVAFGLFSAIDNMLSTFFSNLFPVFISVVVLICWILLFELCYSVARYINSGSRIRDNFLTYKIFVLIKRLIKAIVRAFEYKSKTVKTKSILLVALWFAVNLIVMGVTYICAYNAIPLSLLILLADAIVNTLIMIKVIKYLVTLDTIIDAFSQHQEPVVDIDSLPKSLQILSESMKYTNTELQNAVAKAVKDERLRSELITNVSHDLKTPLTSIITYVDLLSKCDINDPKAREYIAVLDDKGAKLKRLIEDLIEASKVTSGNVSVNLTTINLSELCLQSTVDAQPDFEKAGLDLIVKDCEKPPVISADGAKTFRIIENLLSNARKYSAKASRVYVDVYSQNGYGIFEIKNISAQPLDISPDELTERFVRGDKSRNQEGNGLGLSIAKELCRLQNGYLELIIDGDLFKARVKLPLA